MTDDILEEVRRVREAYAEKFNFDLAAICRDIREQERLNGREVISLPPKRIVPVVDVSVTGEADVAPASSEAPVVVRDS